jgi:hypothetical protein
MVSKSWPGRLGFPQFLAAFRDGGYAFQVSDFEEYYQRLLRKRNISSIRVYYTIDHAAADEVVSLLGAEPGAVPASITECGCE